MLKVENVEVFGWKSAIRGMRNPLNSWGRSDSGVDIMGEYEIGTNDMDLMIRLIRGGSPHRKFLRMIHVAMDITAPLYWWKEFDTYKIGTVANSCSTMHKLTAKPFELDDFSHEHLLVKEKMTTVIQWLNAYREMYVNWVDSTIHVDDYGNEVTKKDIWWQMIQLLPSSYNQTRTIDMNYETVMNIIRWRTGHKLDEWHTLIDEFYNLPYMKTFTGKEEQ